jgi:putative DNA primase/helicase
MLYCIRGYRLAKTHNGGFFLMPRFDNPDLLNAIDASEPHLGTLTDRAIMGLRASNHPPSLFISGTSPVRVREIPGQLPIIDPIDLDKMRYELDRRINWFRRFKTDQGEDMVIRVSPKLDLVRNVIASPDLFDLPRLSRVVTSPIFAQSGELQFTPGYNPSTQTYYSPVGNLDIPAVSPTPSQDEVDAARSLLWDTWLGDFPYQSVAEHANAIALVITPFVREMITGATPLHLIEKNHPGTGATLMADCTTILMLGEMAESGPSSESDAEWRKRISSKLMSSDPFFYIDNVSPGSLDYASIKQVLTVGKFEDRRLGTNELVKERVRCVWIATANNLALPSELIRRTVRIRLHAPTDRPGDRRTVENGGDIRIPNLRMWTAENRATLLWAIYTLVQNWLAKGRPYPTVAPVLGSFEEYCIILGGILESSGVGGFLCNREDTYASADPFEIAFSNFLFRLYRAFGSNPITISDMMPYTEDLNLGSFGDRGRRVQLGHVLGNNNETPHGEYSVVSTKPLNGYSRYKIVFKPKPQEME